MEMSAARPHIRHLKDRKPTTTHAHLPLSAALWPINGMPLGNLKAR